MKRKIIVSLICTFFMIFGVAISASAGSYWTEGTYSGDYYEVYGVVKGSDVYPFGTYYKASMGHANNTRSLKIRTRVYTNYYGSTSPAVDYYTNGSTGISTSGDRNWIATYAKYEYYISGSQIKAVTVYK